MGMVLTEPLYGGEESIAAIANGMRASSRMASASDQVLEKRRAQSESRYESSGAAVQLTQCYCDGCRLSCCIGRLFFSLTSPIGPPNARMAAGRREMISSLGKCTQMTRDAE